MARLSVWYRACFVLLSVWLFTSLTHAQSVDGIFKVVKGDVKVQQAANNQIVKAKIGQRVFPHDTVITSEDSRAKVVMVDGNIINIMPSTKFIIQAYQYQPSQDKKNVLLNVMYGKIRTTVQQKYIGTNKFQVKTPSAVAGVRGTDFITSYNATNNTSSIITFRGRVEFGKPGPNGQISNSVFVSAGQMSKISGVRPPSAPTEMPRNFMVQMDNQSKADTSSPRAPASGLPNSGSTPNPQPNNSGTNNHDDGHRQPASVSIGGAPTGTMLLPADFPTVDGAMSGTMPTNVLPPPNMPFMQAPTNNFVHNVLMNSATKRVNVSITTGP